jgi:hypothetical protein
MSAPVRIRKEFRTRDEWDAFVERVARAALMAYFDPNPSPVKTGAADQEGSGHRDRWSQFEDMKQNKQRRDAALAVKSVLQSDAHDDEPSSSSGSPTSGSPSGAANQYEASPGWWQPEVKIEGSKWSTKIPPGRSVPHRRQGRVFGLSHTDDNLTPFQIFYVDDKHAGMGPIYKAHGVWSLDFFTPDGTGIVVNDDDDARFDGGPYRLRFRKISEP